ncbi:MAG: DEAD/DEAH box helicase [Gammaproteobacteria bacterium]|nr:DEAD/DEAH box helicase [Gammaproteobacteria bacterium]
MQTSSFSDLGLAPSVLKAIAAIGYETPSPIQAQSIPLLLEGKNLLGTAQTGTGKTAAFALPLLSRIDPEQQAPQILVLTPTRELAIQVAEAFSKYAAGMRQFHVLPIYGGSDFRSQFTGLRRGAQVIVGTPGRILDHLRRGSLNLGELRALVLDEADEMLRMGFIDDVEEILSTTPASCQRALFSATMPPPIRKVASKYLPDAEEIRVASTTATVERIAQFVLTVFPDRKLDALTRILEVEDFDAAIIFVRTRAETTEVSERLAARGHAVAALNGDLNQRQRERTVEDIKSGKIDIIVATDVAARGLDVPRISHVINYDIPYDTEAYVHRVGRTGRAGREGRAILLVTPRERGLLRSLERATRQEMQPLRLPSPEEMLKLQVAQFESQLVQMADGDDLAATEALLQGVAERHHMNMAQVAIALARWLDASQPGVLPLRAPEPLPMPADRGPADRDFRPRPRNDRPRTDRPRGDRPPYRDRDGADRPRGNAGGGRGKGRPNDGGPARERSDRGGERSGGPGPRRRDDGQPPRR